MSDVLAALHRGRLLLSDYGAPPLFGSWSLAARDEAWKYHVDGQDYVLAHPDFWSRMPPTPPKSRVTGGFFELQIHELDGRPELLRQFLAALAQAMAQKQ